MSLTEEGLERAARIGVAAPDELREAVERSGLPATDEMAMTVAKLTALGHSAGRAAGVVASVLCGARVNLRPGRNEHHEHLHARFLVDPCLPQDQVAVLYPERRLPPASRALPGATWAGSTDSSRVSALADEEMAAWREILDAARAPSPPRIREGR